VTDRHIAYTVTLLEPVRSDDAERIIDAIRMVKGVADVVPVVATPEAYWARSRARSDLLREVVDLLNQREGDR